LEVCRDLPDLQVRPIAARHDVRLILSSLT
jgi:hypothetical protein